MDKSYILNVIDLIKKSAYNTKYKVYAIVAPSISSQFTYAKLGQVITGLKELGFFTVIEAALGADMVAQAESKELAEKGFLTSSCCPAFVQYIKSAFPDLLPLVSHNLSPMAALAKYIKSTDETAKVVFIGPCTAKKAEAQLESVKPYVDAVMTFEELQALYDSKDIDITTLAEDVLDANFIEGMACVGGCIGGAGCLTHGEKNKSEVDKYGREAFEKTISDAIAVLK